MKPSNPSCLFALMIQRVSSLCSPPATPYACPQFPHNFITLATHSTRTHSLRKTVANTRQRADATIEAREATGSVADSLGLDTGKPVLVMRQIAVDQHERPLFVSTITYAGERYRLRTFFARTR